ncbi:transcriptional repressor [Rhodococcus fascians]|nr:transcriptional repressor [Rhodococcus fascians]MBY3995124.1 transcriptional repressor [Rhodococcus fascians]MBY4000556.1 transcriptional repressor [Rhodococcus fascians]MBY4005584.1 transcriptional repressor [Rhodococcus fascians]MBY4016417.1 transcriptional repressor [Rhodococcus fascians]
MASKSAGMIRDAGLRVTRPRVIVLDIVAAQPHSDTDTILRSARGTLPAVSKQAVYDVLEALTTSGLLRRIRLGGHSARYETRVGDNHHHLVCRVCGVIVDADCAVGAPPCIQPDHDHGFVLDEAEVTYWGTCPDCALTQTIAARDHLHKTPSIGKDHS